MLRALSNNMQISLDTDKSAIIAMAVLFNIRKIKDDDEDYGIINKINIIAYYKLSSSIL